MVLIRISIMTDHVLTGHLYMSSLEKSLLKSFVHLGCWFFCRHVARGLSISWVPDSHQTHDL